MSGAARRVERFGEATLILGDCLSLAAGDPLLPAPAPDLALISDPPYGIRFIRGRRTRTSKRWGGKSGRAHQNKFAEVAIAGDDAPFDPRIWLGYGNVVLWGADHFYPRLPGTGRFLAWNKLAGRRSWDRFADVEFAWHSRSGASRVFSYLWKGLCREDGGGTNSQHDHPMQKPTALMAWRVEQAAPPGVGQSPLSHVFDPYMGSGTTGVAALSLGLRFTGVEIDERWFDAACRRIEAAAKEPRIAFCDSVPKIAQGELF